MKVCTRCVLDETVKDIIFDKDGICNYCKGYEDKCSHIVYKDEDVRVSELNKLVSKIKKDGKNKQYDCIVGVSGGVDSSWVLVKAKELGLRPLAVHMDNGWNSELAQNNIENLITKLDVDLYTHVINWVEYKSLMQAFFDADVIDVELLYDNAMLAVNYQLASKFGVKYILSGCNMATEGIRIPTGWNWLKKDKRNIKSIANLFGNVKIDSFPIIGTIDFIRYEFVKNIKWLPFLDNFKFDKKEALDILEKKYEYKPYPYKHYESVFTRFYQGYILPQKFNVDKRKLHLSTLIMSSQIERTEAINILKDIPYNSALELEEDIDYFLKKMGWTHSELDDYLKRPEKYHHEYPSEYKFWDLCQSVYLKLKNR
ncbi:N-acetyl sugar amidotransferase [Photobacterium leiognathi]|uniref:N-acetyl sugar amidotransferase n=1 Tax=Photobacterium leiognathi TaxID=553611 RepID=UPI0029821627|nr:N-acetyl sugar amidotransferase [Photobacterium leiognathi]